MKNLLQTHTHTHTHTHTRSKQKLQNSNLPVRFTRDKPMLRKNNIFHYFHSLICNYPLSLSLCPPVFVYVSLSHSLLYDINWQGAEYGA